MKKEVPFRIEKREAIRVVGYAIQTTNQRGEGRKRIPAHWEDVRSKEKQERLFSLANQEHVGLYGINIYNIDEADSRIFRYLIGVASDAQAVDGLSAYTIPALTWAVFPCTVDTIGKTEAQAITKWLPKSKYKALNKGYLTGRMKSAAPDIEYYTKDGVEVWIGVEEK